MRIDPNRAMDPNALTPPPKTSARAAGVGEEASAGQTTIGGDGNALSLDQVRRTLQTSSQDRIARAKALISSGELDTPAAAQRAAQNLAKFGI